VVLYPLATLVGACANMKGVMMGSKAGQKRRGKKKVKGVDLTTYTTQKGLTIKLMPVNRLTIQMIRSGVRAEFREAGEPIATPTYEAKTVADDVEELPLDAKSLEVPGDEEETKRRTEVWAAHQDALTRLGEEEQNRVTRYQLIEGVDVEVPDGFDAKMEKYGIEVPEDPDDRRLLYIMTTALTTMQEVFDVTIRLMALTNRAELTQEMLEAAEATFRS